MNALAELAASLHGELLERVRLMMGDEARGIAESTDFVQSAVADALARTDHAPPDRAALLRWMTAAARNNIRDDVRRRRERAFTSFSMSQRGEPRAATPSPSSEADHDERLYALAEALEALPEEERRAIELRDLEGWTFAQIAARLGGSDDRARRLHARAVLHLGRLMGRRDA